MKYYLKEHTIYSHCCQKDIHIVHISDLHESEVNDKDFLYDLFQKIAYLNPNYICFTGDLFDNAACTLDASITSRIKLWLESLGTIAPVLLIRGNHDCLSFPDKLYFESKAFFESLNDIPNVHALIGNKFKDDEKTFVGLDLQDKALEYYEESKEGQRAFQEYVTPNLNKIKEELDPEALNILLFHSPVHILDEMHEEYTLLLSGHMHNGALPPIMDKIIPGHSGLLAPVEGYFPDNARGIKTVSDTSLVIAPPLVMNRKRQNNPLIRKLYKPGIECITLKKK